MKVFGLTTYISFLAATGILISAAFAGTKAPANFVQHSEPKPLPNIEFEDGSGQKIRLADFKGRLVLLNIWATWCAPCRKEMPTLDRLQQQLGGEMFEVLALSLDQAGPAVVRKFYADIGIQNLRLIIDRNRRAMRDLRVIGLPTTLLIGKNGEELGRLVGPAEWDAEEMVAYFKSHLDDTTN